VDAIDTSKASRTDLQDSLDLNRAGEMEDDKEVVAEAEARANEAFARLPRKKKLEARLLTARPDQTILSSRVQFGRGWHRSCDWPACLARM